jgi:hypothetical protein
MKPHYRQRAFLLPELGFQQVPVQVPVLPVSVLLSLQQVSF